MIGYVTLGANDLARNTKFDDDAVYKLALSLGAQDEGAPPARALARLLRRLFPRP